MAGTTNIGDMHATLTLSAWEFQQGLKQSEVAALEFAKQTENQVNSANNSLNKIGQGTGGGAARALQQVGFGLQDFMSQLDTRGLSGAIGAVTNNVQMLGAAFGPTGMAVSALGGAIGGILLPKLIEASGWFEDGKKKTEAYRDSLEQWRKSYADSKAMERTLLAGGLGNLNEVQADKNAEINLLQEQIGSLHKSMEDTRNRAEAANEHYENARVQSLQNGGSWMGTGANPAEDMMRGYDELGRKLDELQTKQMTLIQLRNQAEKLRPTIEKIDKAHDSSEEWMKQREEDWKAEQTLQKFRDDGLTKYGTEAQKLQARLAKEKKDFEESTLGALEQEAGLRELNDRQAFEREKLRVGDHQKYIDSLGKDAGPSKGLDANSSEGMSAIIRATMGAGEKSVAMQQLQVEKKQLEIMEQQLRSPEDKTLLDSVKGDPILGSPQSMGSMGGDNLTKFVTNEESDAIVQKALARGRDTSGINDILALKRQREMEAPNNTNNVLSAKREREAGQSAAADKKLQAVLEQIRDDARRKPVSRVVALNG